MIYVNFSFHGSFSSSGKDYGDDNGFSKERLDIQDKPKFNKRFSNQVPSKFPKDRDDSMSEPKIKKGWD